MQPLKTIGIASIWLVSLAVLARAMPEMPDDTIHGQKDRPVATVDFNREVSPILSRHCFECHGPDSQERQAKLRLDRFADATAPRKSGPPAIVPGASHDSELIQRVCSRDDDLRMPPPEKGPGLSPAQIDVLTRWIDQGARYEVHWAFVPPLDPPLPEVQHQDWPQQPLDFFILAKLEQAGLEPGPAVARRTLIRRAYFDLLGLPPTPAEVRTFVEDSSPDAFAKVVEHLLGSPHYGERWGRHWLDVARYGDSNGGDENRAYPLAHHYRNYVIRAFNLDLPYDEFLHQQIAGDLLKRTQDSDREQDRITATGFLALGTKILAEQDPVKKRADMIDEQIDTFGQAILGLTLGCARCHDHKFDPISARDYYGLAGIFHSTQLEDRTIESPAFAAAKARHLRQLQALEVRSREAQRQFEESLDLDAAMEWEAESFVRGNAAIDRDNYGKGIGIISDPGAQDNYAEYDVVIPQPGPFLIRLRYTAATARPGRLLINGAVVKEKALAGTTGGWMPPQQLWFNEAVVNLEAGKIVLRLESKPMMSHIDKVGLIPIRSSSTEGLEPSFAVLEQIQRQLTDLRSRAPQPAKVMGVSDGKVGDIKIHKRGNHRDLGMLVPRRVPTEIGAQPVSQMPPDRSGRLELVRWLTHPEHPLTARVMVNRLWRWHFGKGIVGTPDNFGTQGQRPSHRLLLDHLACRFIADGWSIKTMHRRIMLSSTYQLASQIRNPRAEAVDPGNTLYWRRDVNRLEAEAFRDALLALSGRLDRSLGGGPMRVVSQDPSPGDLAKNRAYYENSRRRSVYLPVVRSNGYNLLTLLDFPNAATPVGSRVTTTVPTQALLLMNHTHLADQVAHITRVILPNLDQHSPEALLQWLYEALLCRPGTPEEEKWGLRFVKEYAAAADEPTGP